MTERRAAPSMVAAESLGALFDARAVDGAGGSAAAQALTDGRRTLTWADYRNRAGRLAAVVAAHGVAAGDRVAVNLPKSVDSFVAVHAVLRLGAVVVPVDPLAAPAYVERLLGDADVRAIVTPTGNSAVESTVARVDPADVPDAGPIAPVAVVAPSDPAYIIYTSGSTGTPKGIVHTHSSALAYARRAAAVYGLTDRDRLANFAPLHFDQSTFELYAALVAGSAVVVIPDGVSRFPASVSDLLAREGTTVWYTVPYAIAQLVDRGDLGRRDLGSLRWVLFGGENFPPAALAAAMRALPGVRFSNVYGPAEVNQCTFHHLDEAPVSEQPVPIGWPWDRTEVLVVDGDRPVAPGEPGELLVSTDTMMIGYFRRPDLTATAIVERCDDGVTRRWYRTGDLVRCGDDGLVFIGRVDHQVKVRGHRIELEAVEMVLGEDPAVDACAAVVDRAGDRLVAVVAPPPDEATRRALDERLRGRLPSYAVPSAIVGVPALPRTPTGKVDRRATLAQLGTAEPGETTITSSRHPARARTP